MTDLVNLQLLLDIYNNDYNGELERMERIQNKATTIFGFASGVPALLVGLFVQGEFARLDAYTPAQYFSSLIYVTSIMIFVLSAILSIDVSRIAKYMSITLTLKPETLDKIISSRPEQIMHTRIQNLLDTTLTLTRINEKKAKQLQRAQVASVVAILFVLFSMVLLLIGVVIPV